MAGRGRPKKLENFDIEFNCSMNLSEDLLPQLIGEPGEADVDTAMKVVVEMDRFFDNSFLIAVYEWAYDTMIREKLIVEEEEE